MWLKSRCSLFFFFFFVVRRSLYFESGFRDKSTQDWLCDLVTGLGVLLLVCCQISETRLSWGEPSSPTGSFCSWEFVHYVPDGKEEERRLERMFFTETHYPASRRFEPRPPLVFHRWWRLSPKNYRSTRPFWFGQYSISAYRVKYR